MDVCEAVETRRSIREFTVKPVGKELIKQILNAGRLAPSGLNNQPWRFKVVDIEAEKDLLSECTKYSQIIKSAPLFIAVFLDDTATYDRTKDVQAVGACIQNMLLTVHSLGLGAVWLGEILNQREKAEAALNTPSSCELMAVIAVGHPLNHGGSFSRKALDELML